MKKYPTFLRNRKKSHLFENKILSEQSTIIKFPETIAQAKIENTIYHEKLPPNRFYFKENGGPKKKSFLNLISATFSVTSFK